MLSFHLPGLIGMAKSSATPLVVRVSELKEDIANIKDLTGIAMEEMLDTQSVTCTHVQRGHNGHRLLPAPKLVELASKF